MADEPRYAGFEAVAKELTVKADQRISRQLVYTWWRRRSRNGFPDRKRVTLPDGRVKYWLDVDEVLKWHASYTPSKGGRHRKASAESSTRQGRGPTTSVSFASM